MNWPILIVIGSQIMFTTSDIVARAHMSKNNFELATFLSAWFFAYFLIRTIAMFGQLYVFTTIELGKTMALFGAASIILSNSLGLLVLKEVLPVGTYIGISFAIIAYIIIATT